MRKSEEKRKISELLSICDMYDRPTVWIVTFKVDLVETLSKGSNFFV